MGLFSFLNKQKSTEIYKNGVVIDHLPFDVIDQLNEYQSSTFPRNKVTLLTLYETVPEVNAIVNYLAGIMANTTYQHVKLLANGKTKQLRNTELLQLLAKPNDLKSNEAFFKDLYVQLLIFGETYISKFKSIGFDIPLACPFLFQAA